MSGKTGDMRRVSNPTEPAEKIGRASTTPPCNAIASHETTRRLEPVFLCFTQFLFGFGLASFVGAF